MIDQPKEGETVLVSAAGSVGSASSLIAKGRIPVCGVLSQYNAEDKYYGVTNTRLIFNKQLRLQGFLNSEFRDQWNRDRAELENLVALGKLKYRETVAQGLKSAPQAFIGML
jgi:hypothetical protein